MIEFQRIKGIQRSIIVIITVHARNHGRGRSIMNMHVYGNDRIGCTACLADGAKYPLFVVPPAPRMDCKIVRSVTLIMIVGAVVVGSRHFR